MDKKRTSMFVKGLNLITFSLDYTHGKKKTVTIDRSPEDPRLSST